MIVAKIKGVKKCLSAEELKKFCKECEEIEVYKSAELNVCPVNGAGAQEGEVFSWVLSTANTDRDGEIVRQDGWETDSYLKNPVVLWAHDYAKPAIGRCINIGIVNGTLFGQVVFNSREVDPFAWGIKERVKNGSIKGGSVGFRVLDADIETIDGREVLCFKRMELLEFSICNVPANPFALCTEIQNQTAAGAGSNKSTENTDKGGFYESLKRVLSA